MSAGGSPFKDEIGRSSIRALGRALVAVDRRFPVERFVRRSCLGLGDLELKARIAHVAANLGDALGDRPFPDAADLVARAVAADDGLDTWSGWPAQTWLETAGLEHPAAALDAIGRITPVATGELAVRPYLAAHPDLALGVVHRWAGDASEHRRRLASEGTRPRLPWATRLRAFVADPTPVVAVLDRLVADDSEYVRRSVANNLNDIAKDHPDLAVATARRWWALDDDRARGVVRHGLRTLVKAGDEDALALLGYRTDAPVSVGDLRVGPAVVELGDDLVLEVDLTARGPDPVPVVVDYVLHRVVADGSTSPKVHKWTTRTLEPERPTHLRKVHRLRAVTVRTYHPGVHTVEVLVNGRRGASATFDLRSGG